MALTAKQKDFLILMASNPDEAYIKLTNNEIDLNSFKNESLKDGTSLLHVVMTGYLNNYNSYKKIMMYILDNSKLDLENSPISAVRSPIKFFMSKGDTNDKYLEQLKELTDHHKYFSVQFYFETLTTFYSTKKEIYNEILDMPLLENLDSKNISHAASLIRNIISNDDVGGLEYLLNKKPKLISYLNRINLEPSYYTHSENMLLCSLRNNKKNIATYLIDNNDKFNFSHKGRVLNPYDTNRMNKSETTLSLILKNDTLQFLEKIILNISNSEFIDILKEQPFIKEVTTNAKLVPYKNLFFSKIKTIFEENQINFSKTTQKSIAELLFDRDAPLSVFNDFVSPFNDLEKKYFFENNIYLNNQFFAKINKDSKIYNQEEIDQIIDNFKLLKEYNCLYSEFYSFNLELLKNYKLLQKLAENGLFDIYKNNEHDIFGSKNILEYILDNKSHVKNINENSSLFSESLQLIINEHLKTNKITENLLIKSIQTKMSFLFTNLEKNNFSQINFNNTEFFNALKNSGKSVLHAITYKFLSLDLGLDPFYNYALNNKNKKTSENIVQLLLSYAKAKKPLEMILKKHNPKNITLQEIVNQKYTWDTIDKDNLSYLASKDIDFNNLEISKIVYFQKSYEFLEKFIQLENITFNNEIILQSLQEKRCDNPYGKYFLIIEHQPELLRTTSIDNKYLLNYLVEDLEIAIQNNVSNFIKYNNIKEIIHRNINSHLINIINEDLNYKNLYKNEEAFQKLNDTIQQCVNIAEYFPDIMTKFNYLKLDHSLKNTSVKTQKLKI